VEKPVVLPQKHFFPPWCGTLFVLWDFQGKVENLRGEIVWDQGIVLRFLLFQALAVKLIIARKALHTL
jgi:hypothetical protein